MTNIHNTAKKVIELETAYHMAADDRTACMKMGMLRQAVEADAEHKKCEAAVNAAIEVLKLAGIWDDVRAEIRNITGK